MQQSWQLDPAWTFLNHGSFGARLNSVAHEQERWRQRLEKQPMRFLLDEYLPRLDEARSVLAELVGAQSEDLVFVPNATYGVNSVLRSWSLKPGDEILVLDQAYGACRAALDYVAHRQEARVVQVTLPFPVSSPDQITAAIMERVSPRTRFAMIDAVISPTGWVLPIEEIVSSLKDHGVETLVDAAHSPGLVGVDFDRCGAAFTTANLHKWICAPLGTACLHVRSDWRDRIFPCALSHGLHLPKEQRWQDCYDWTGTFDPSAWLSFPFALEALKACHPEGLEGLMKRNSDLAWQGAQMLNQRLGYELTAPASMFGAMTSLFLPLPAHEASHHLETDPLQRRLIDGYQIEIPILSFAGRRMVRISCQAYSDLAQLEHLGEALAVEVAKALS